MSDLPVPTPGPRPAETPAVVAAPPAVPGPPADPHAVASGQIQAAVEALEASRSGSLDEQLAAAEHVHEVLSGHLAGGSGRS